MRHPYRLALIVLAPLMLLSLDHGLPHRYLPDDTLVRCALGMARDAQAEGLAGLVPPAGTYTTYPYLGAYLDLAAIGAVFAGGRVLGAWGGAGEFQEALYADPGLAWLPARVLGALFGLLVSYGIYRAARELSRSRGEAALAALLAGSSQLLVLYAHTSRPWAPMLAGFALTLWLCLRALRKRNARALLLAWCAAGAAFACFQVGALVLAFPALSSLVLLLRAGGSRSQVALGAVGGVLSAGLIVLLLGMPYLLVHGQDDAQGVITGQESARSAAAAAEKLTVEVGGQAFRPQLFGGARLAHLTKSWFGNEPVLLVLGGLGLLLTLRGPRRVDAVLLIGLPTLCFAAVFLLYDGSHVRYLLPATLLLSFGAAAVLGALARRGSLGAALALALLAVPLVQAARLDQLLGREDTRTIAARELLASLPADARVAVDSLGSRYAPPWVSRPDALRDLYELSAEYPEAIWLSRTEQRALGAADASGELATGAWSDPEARWFWPISRFYAGDVYVAEDHRAGSELDLPGFFARWQLDHYVQVDRLPDDARRAEIRDFTARHGELLVAVSPTGESAPARAQLPTDMDFPLTELWRQERPGPWIRLWRLSPTPTDPAR